jgi:hypothetical protein
MRELLVEGLMLGSLSVVAALAVASVVLRAGQAVFFATVPPTFAAVARVLPLDVDRRVFVFTAVIAALGTIVFAVLPALQATRMSLTTALRGELSSGVRGSRLRNVLVIGQVAVSLRAGVCGSGTGPCRGRLRPVAPSDAGRSVRRAAGLVTLAPRGLKTPGPHF